MCNAMVKVRKRADDTFLPVCEIAEMFCALIQGNSIDAHRLDVIRKLGYKIEVVQTGDNHANTDQQNAESTIELAENVAVHS